MTATLPERHANLLLAILPLCPSKFHAGDILFQIAGLAEREHLELKAALAALLGKKKFTRPAVGQLLKRMRGRPYGAYKLDGEFDTSTKSWRYWLAPSDEIPITPAEQLDFAKEELETLKNRPIVGDAEIRAIDANPKRTESIINKAERAHDKKVAAAEREVKKATREDPDIAAVLKQVNKEQRAALKLPPGAPDRVESSTLNPYLSDATLSEALKRGVWERHRDGTYSKIGDYVDKSGSVHHGMPGGLAAAEAFMYESARAAGANDVSLGGDSWRGFDCGGPSKVGSPIAIGPSRLDPPYEPREVFQSDMGFEYSRHFQK